MNLVVTFRSEPFCAFTNPNIYVSIADSCISWALGIWCLKLLRTGALVPRIVQSYQKDLIQVVSK